jgi:3-oxoacyl-[acyl-carrier-protein] synthase II
VSQFSSPRRRVVITGLGPITCAGTGRAPFWQNIRDGKSGVGWLTAFDPGELKARLAGEVRDWDGTNFFPPHRIKRLDRYAQFSVASTLLALEDAGFPWGKELPQARVGVSFGTALGGIANAEHEHQRFLKKGVRGVNPTLALQVFGGSAHSNIAIEFNFRGPGTTNSNSCASGIISVGEAMRYIRDGMADVMIAGGAEAPLSPLTFGAFDFIKTMSRYDGENPAEAYRPFDARRDGFIMGEGAASLVLEELGHAQRRGAPIYAEVLGYHLNNEAWHMTTPLPGGECVIHCMQAALADAGVEPAQIDYINAHASGTQLNDENESAAVKAVFGGGKLPLVSGTKPFTAHPLGATGAIETAICALALRDQYVPPTLNYAQPDPGCDLDIVPNEGRSQKLEFVLNNAFGFGGINASLVLGRANF